MALELLSKTNDRVFKEIFIRNKSCMADFLKSILNIPDEEFEDLEYVDTHSRHGSILGGEYILDIKVKTKSYIIDVEMQVKRSPVMRQRIVLYLANMIKEQDLSSVNYSKMKKTVSIMIAAEHNINDDNRYFHRYNLRDEKDNSLFTDLLEVDVLELKKLPDQDDGSPLWEWLAFIKTTNEEKMKILADKNAEIEKAYDTLLNISGDEAERHAAQQHEMYLQDQLAINNEKFEQGIEKGREEGREEGKEEGREERNIEITRNLIKLGMSNDQIAAATGLSLEKIKELKNDK